MTVQTNSRQSALRRLTASFGRLDRLTKSVLIAFLLAGAVTGALAFGYIRQFVESSPSFSIPGLAIHEEVTSPSGDVVSPASGDVYNYQKPAPWDGSSRVNILILGLDARDWETGQGAPRTDTMMVLTYDPVTKTAGMISIPRDLWVDIPGFGHDKVNNAYALGEGNRLPGGGAGLAVQTVEQLLGITINFYAQIDFSAFERFIDIIGGVKIDIQQRVKVQIIGEDRDRVIERGRQVLNGAYALAYARARHTEDGDFDRARRQQEVILAGFHRLISMDGVRRAPELYEIYRENVITDMSFEDISPFLPYAAHMGEASEFQHFFIGPQQVTSWVNYSGAQVLIPIQEAALEVMRQALNSP